MSTCPRCSHRRIDFAYGMLETFGDGEGDASAKAFDPEPWLVVEMGCALQPLPDGSYLGGYCPACGTVFSIEDDAIDWQPAWGQPTDHVPAIDAPEELVEAWIGGDPEDPVDDVRTIAELGRWRADPKLELTACVAILDRLVTQQEYEEAEAVARRALPLLDRVGDTSAERDVHAGFARVNAARGDSAAALPHWRQALDAGERADDGYVLAWVRADAAATFARARAYDQAVALVTRAVGELEANRDTDIASMACDTAARTCQALDRHEEALTWLLRSAENELAEQDFWEVGPATRRAVEAVINQLRGQSDDKIVREQLARFLSRLEPEQFDHHRDAATWADALLRGDDRSGIRHV